MTIWNDPAMQGAIVAHIGDLHFGISSSQHGHWERVASLLRAAEERLQLVLVTGDVVDTPHPQNWRAAKRALDGLGVEYRLCPGNHDVHFLGNRVRVLPASLVRWLGGDIGTHFGSRVASLRPETIPIRSPRRTWKVSLAAVDSSSRADEWARGFVTERDLDTLEHWQQSPNLDRQSDLAILLVHHHPLPVRELEAAHRGNWRHLANVKALINAGSFLERVARAGFDVILHGHEHCSQWARYGSLEAGGGDVRVVGTGSATGVHDRRCRVKSQSLNLLVLRDAGDLLLNIVSYTAGGWEITKRLRLARPEDLRHSQALRVLGHEVVGDKRVSISRFTKFEANGNYETTLVQRDVIFPKRCLWMDVSVRGTLDRPRVIASLGPDVSVDCGATLEPCDAGHRLGWTLPDAMVNVPIGLHIHYCCTGSDRNGGAWPLLQGETTFVALTSDKRTADLDFAVLLPAEVAPPRMQARVYSSGNEIDTESQEFAAGLVREFPGWFVCRVACPRADRQYVLAW